MVNRINTATKAEIESALEAGGCVRFVWVDSEPVLAHPTGWEQAIDGRSYQGFLRTLAKKCVKVETGTTENKDLVIEWRKAQ